MLEFHLLILAIIQGITEFFPVSSSGHLVLAEDLLHFNPPGIFLEILFHLATLISVFLYFHKFFRNIFLHKKKFFYEFLFSITVGTLPVAIVGIFFSKKISIYFDNPDSLAFFFIANGILLSLNQFRKQKTISESPDESPTLKAAFIIGLAQILSLFPGISRSGTTITAGLLLGLHPNTAFRFSFLLSIPAILGAGLLTFSDISYHQPLPLIPSILSFLVVLLTGIFSLYLLHKIIQRPKFLPIFGYYTIALGIVLLFREFVLFP